MRFFLAIITSLIIVGCTNHKSSDNSSKSTRLEDNLTITEPSFDSTCHITERPLQYGNDSYTLRIRTFKDPKTQEFVAEVYLKDKSDTIFMKTITTDSILNNTTRHHTFADSINYDKLQSYKLVDVVSTDGIRNYNSYLIGRLESVNSKDIYVLFSIKALFGETGRMWVNGCSYSSNWFDDTKKDE